jgi:23S rRNA (adenine2503-C2)-methyltransferase
MLKNINDSDHDARALIKLLKNIPSKLNLIPFNPFPNSIYQCSTPERIECFRAILHNAGIVTTIRRTRGDDIDAACGQLVGKVQDKSRRHLKLQQLQTGT